MADTKTLIEQAYSAFNKRDIDGALALMTQDVSWPKASEGGKVVGKEEIRAYWTRQWAEFDPYVEPLAVTEKDGGKTRVRVTYASSRFITSMRRVEGATRRPLCTYFQEPRWFQAMSGSLNRNQD